MLLESGAATNLSDIKHHLLALRPAMSVASLASAGNRLHWVRDDNRQRPTPRVARYLEIGQVAAN